MTMTHSAIAQIFTHRLEMTEFHEEESSVERGRRAEMEAFSLTRLAARLLRWQRAPADPQVELQAAVKRLSELSPHLLIDVGIDPATDLVHDVVTLSDAGHRPSVPPASEDPGYARWPTCRGRHLTAVRAEWPSGWPRYQARSAGGGFLPSAAWKGLPAEDRPPVSRKAWRVSQGPARRR